MNINKFTSEELTELEDITRRSTATFRENSKDVRGEDVLKALDKEKTSQVSTPQGSINVY